MARPGVSTSRRVSTARIRPRSASNEREGTAIGTDLYREDFPQHHAKTLPALQQARTERDLLLELKGPTADRRLEGDWERFADPEVQAKQEAVDRAYEAIYAHPFHFRDSYNESSLFFQLDLGWSETASRLCSVEELFWDSDEPVRETIMMGRNLLVFHSEIVGQYDRLHDRLDAMHLTGQAELASSFLEKYERLLEFLLLAYDGEQFVVFAV